MSKISIEDSQSEDAVCWSEGTRLLIEAGAEFLLPTEPGARAMCLDRAWAVSSSLRGVYREAVSDCFEEHMGEVFSKDPTSLGGGERSDPMRILAEFAGGMIIEFEHVWREVRPSIADDERSLFESVLKEMVQLAVSVSDRIHKNGLLCYDDNFCGGPGVYLEEMISRMFKTASMTGRFDKANDNLAFLISYSSNLAQHLIDRGLPRNYVSGHFLYRGNTESLAILEQAGLAYNKSCYWKMIDLWSGKLPEISVWQRYVDDGVDPVVLNWILVQILPHDRVHRFGDVRFTTDHFEFLLHNGADVNYVALHLICCHIPRTPIGFAVGHGEIDNVRFLLQRGANIWLDVEGSPLSHFAEWQEHTEQRSY